MASHRPFVFSSHDYTKENDFNDRGFMAAPRGYEATADSKVNDQDCVA